MLNVLHTGDIHLDSPFSRLDARGAALRREEIRAAFVAMMDYAKKSGVDLILIAGDLFDNAAVTKETLSLVQREFSLFDGPIVISPGNHDYYAPGSIYEVTPFSENVHIFREASLSVFSFPALHTDVYGYAFTAQKKEDSPLTGARVTDPEKINLACVHGELAVPLSPYGPLARRDILSFGADYVALGHIHNPEETVTENGVTFGYCGCLEGRGHDEEGVKGATAVTIEKTDGHSTVKTERIRFSRRRYESLSVDVSFAETLTDIENRLGAAIEKGGFSEDTLLRADLWGQLPPTLLLDTSALENRFPALFSLEIKDRTTPLLSPKDYENDRTVRGAFYRAMAEKIENGSPAERAVATRALRYGLAAIAGENVSDL